jgi:hypothetical protein
MDLRQEQYGDGYPMDNTFDEVSVASGYEVSVCKSYYLYDPCIELQGGDNGSVYDLSQYGYENEVSSFEYRRSSPLFNTFVYRSNYPHDREYCGDTSCLNQSIQGVAHDQEYWYFTNRWYIFRIPQSTPIGQIDPRDYTVAYLPDGCDHFGDLDYYKPVASQPNGKLYLPVEGCPSSDNNKTRLYIYDTNDPSTPEKWVKLANHSKLAWVSVHPDTGKVYAQWKSENYHYFDVYPDITSTPNGTVVYEENYYRMQYSDGSTYPCPSGYLQGGKISKNNYLYMTTDGGDGTGGIHIFKIKERKAIFKKYVHPNGYNPSSGEEIEGIDLFDVDGLGIPNIPYGQIHWLLLDDDYLWSPDDFYFKHISVSPSDWL